LNSIGFESPSAEAKQSISFSYRIGDHELEQAKEIKALGVYLVF
jgi:hypothetical protein